jgi:hypothetical protein
LAGSRANGARAAVADDQRSEQRYSLVPLIARRLPAEDRHRCRALGIPKTYAALTLRRERHCSDVRAIADWV